MQGEIEANFEGVGKKNTRKKKLKESNMQAIDDLAGAFDEGADSDEVHAKKGGKSNKNKDKQGKKHKKRKDSSEHEEEKKETAQVEEEEIKVIEAPEEEEEFTPEFPLNVVYCQSKYTLLFYFNLRFISNKFC